MNQNEIHGLLNYLKQTAVGFYVVPDKAVASWHKALGKYYRNEAMDAVDFIVSNSSSGVQINYLSAIKNRCERLRHERRSEENRRSGDIQARHAEESFNGIPGNSRSEQIAYVCGQHAAGHWMNGERDNDFYNARILDAQRCGFEFDGVDYSKVIVSANYNGDFFGALAMAAQRSTTV